MDHKIYDVVYNTRHFLVLNSLCVLKTVKRI
jgi:hypothetical protein